MNGWGGYQASPAKSNTKEKKSKDDKKKKTVYTKENPHPMAGSKNAKGTKVIDFKGNWKNI